MRVIVSSLQALPKILAQTPVDHVLSVLPRREMSSMPAIDVPHTVVEVDDVGFGIFVSDAEILEILADDPRCIIPSSSHVDAILAIGQQALAQDWTLLIHCHAGLSRSVAGAYMLLALEDGPGREEVSFARLKALTNDPSPLPNFHLVHLADEALGREGRLFAQIQTSASSDPGSIF